MTRRLLVIDPIFRGSRLHYTALACEAAHRAGLDPIIVTRRNYDSQHYRELLGNVAHAIRPVLSVPEDLWYGRVGVRVAKEIAEVLSGDSSSPQTAFTYLPGLNEIFRSLLLTPWTRDPSARILAVDYKPEFLYPLVSGPRHLLKRALMKRLLHRQPGLHVLTLDERVDTARERPPFRGRVHFVVDPHPTSRTAELRTPTRQEFLLIGRQTRRKGLADVLTAIRGEDRVRLALVGVLTPETEHLRSDIASLSNRFEWTDRFVDEAELANRILDSSYVVLPYTRDFEGSSGVLVAACSYGRPVVATDHGLVGFLVRKYGLGFTVRAGDGQDLRRALVAAPLPGSSEYARLATNCLAFAEGRTAEAHINGLLRAGQHSGSTHD